VTRFILFITEVAGLAILFNAGWKIGIGVSIYCLGRYMTHLYEDHE
jgi:hypothetical protein